MYQNFIIPYFKRSSTCFRQHIAHHQEPKTAQAASGFAYVIGCRMCHCLTSGTLPDNVQQLHVWQPSTVSCKTRGCLCSFRLLMMGGMSPETCWASFKIRNNKIWIHRCILLGFSVRNVLRCTDPQTPSFQSSTTYSVLFFHSEVGATYFGLIN